MVCFIQYHILKMSLVKSVKIATVPTLDRAEKVVSLCNLHTARDDITKAAIAQYVSEGRLSLPQKFFAMSDKE